MPEDTWHDITNVQQSRTRQLTCLQLLVDRRLRKTRERDLAANFVVREKHLQSVARYTPESLDKLDSLGLFDSEIRFHGKTLPALAEEAQILPEETLPQPTLNPTDMPDYRKAFKTVKSLTTDVNETHKIGAESLASCRQISQSPSWHWKLKPQNNLSRLISGWRGGLVVEALHNLLQEYPQ